MAYKIVLKKSAQRELKKLNKLAYKQVRAAIDKLVTNPRPAASKKLVNTPNYRLRVGDYRIIYLIEDNVLTILVIKIGHRREVYR